MPWTAQQFKDRHNKALSNQQAGKAAAQATAMIKAGAPEGEAIATANKHADRRGHAARAAVAKSRKTPAGKMYPSASGE